jgi:hypothetical protein
MGFRFRKSFGVGPIRMTLSKSGVSTSIGVKGARLTRGPQGTRATVGMGGLSYTERLDRPAGGPSDAREIPPIQYRPSIIGRIFLVAFILFAAFITFRLIQFAMYISKDNREQRPTAGARSVQTSAVPKSDSAAWDQWVTQATTETAIITVETRPRQRRQPQQPVVNATRLQF